MVTANAGWPSRSRELAEPYQGGVRILDQLTVGPIDLGTQRAAHGDHLLLAQRDESAGRDEDPRAVAVLPAERLRDVVGRVVFTQAATKAHETLHRPGDELRFGESV